MLGAHRILYRSGEPMRRARAVVVLRLGLATAIAAITVPFIAHAALGEETLAVPTAQIFPTGQGIGVTWDDVDASAYSVQRKQGTADWQDASGDLAASAVSWVDDSLAAGASADYRVLAWSSDTANVASTPVTATRAPQAPVAGDINVLMVDADAGGSPTWLTDELATEVGQSQETGATRTLSAGTLQITLPSLLAGPGDYPVGGSDQPLVVRQKDRDCTLAGTLKIAQLAYTADLQVATLAATFSGSCDGAASVSGEIRFKSSKPYTALSIDPPRVDLGRIPASTDSRRAAATIKNIGTTDLSITVQPFAGTDPRWRLVNDDDCRTLAPGLTCMVQIDLNAEWPGDYVKTVEIADSTSRGRHYITFSASAWGLPTMPTDVQLRSTYSGVDLSWRAAFWGNAKPVGFVVQRTLDGIDTTFTLPPDQLTWTEPHSGSTRASYRVWEVNEFGAGRQTAAVDPPLPARQQLAVFAGRPGEPASLGGIALPNGRQIVPADRAPTGERAGLTSAPNGVDQAYTLADGEKNGLWIRRTDSGAVTDTLLRSAPGIARPAWSPDGARIAFTASGSDSTTCVDVLTLADASVVRVGCGMDFPAWHADGRTLLVQDKRLAGAPLARVEVREQGPRIATLPGSAGATHATLSPTGAWLAFIPAARTDQIGFLPLAGGTPKLTYLPYGTAEALSWDTTGDQLAVLARTATGGPFIVNGDARAVVTGDDIVQWGGVYSGTAEHIEDVAWQGRRVVIKATPAFSGPAVSIPFDTSALTGGERVECWLDDTTKGACASPFTVTGLSTGTHKLQVRTLWSGAPGNYYQAWTTRTFTVDASGPVSRIVAPTFDVSTLSAATVQFAASDATGAVSYDVRYRKASFLSSFGAYVQPWTNITTTAVNLSLDAGYEYCVSVRAKDRLGNVGAWSAEKCFSRPVDDRAMAAPTAGWTRTSWSEFYLGTATQTTSYGASLTRTVQGKRFFLVAARCSTCGLVAVYAGAKYIGAINLASATTQRQAVLPLPVQSTVFSGTLTFTVRSATGKFVQIDGLAVRRS
jgi:hypothetical protein